MRVEPVQMDVAGDLLRHPVLHRPPDGPAGACLEMGTITAWDSEFSRTYQKGTNNLSK